MDDEFEEEVANYPDALNPVTIPLEDTDALKEALGIPVAGSALIYGTFVSKVIEHFKDAKLIICLADGGVKDITKSGKFNFLEGCLFYFYKNSDEAICLYGTKLGYAEIISNKM